MKKHLPFLLILLLGFFTRIYKLESFFGYGHEQDLQAWIVKDILVDKHLRLIGQETSIHGLFIGPLYYYILIPFFAVFNLNPISSYIPITIVSLLTLISVYYVFLNLYDKKTAIIACLIYAISPTITILDRWVVPTQPTLLWTIWFYFVLVNFARGNFKVLPILIVLIGLIWHIHIAFVALLFLVFVAIFWSRKKLFKELVKINKKYLVISLIISFILILPFIAFETRHNFQQIKGLLNINKPLEGEAFELREGKYKVEVIAEYINRVIWQPLFYQANPKNPMITNIPATLILFLVLIYFLYPKGKISKKEMLIFYLWIVDVGASQYFSKRIMSEYYFNNLVIISLIIFSIFISFVYSIKSLKNLVILTLVVFSVYCLGQIIFRPRPVGEYKDKSKIAKFIGEDTTKNNYPCVAINYIGDIPVRYGYRYLLWLNKVNQITPGNDLPVYSIVQPLTISEKEIVFSSGDIGVILPQNPQIPDSSLCSSPERQLLPLNGFVR